MRLVLVQPRLEYSSGEENVGRIRQLLDDQRSRFGAGDLVVLPEHFDLRPDRGDYESGIRELARRFECFVVGGSHHEQRPGGPVNSGVAVSPAGDAIGRYEKIRPYADERNSVGGGRCLGEIAIDGRRVLVLICADFWFSDLFNGVVELPDLVVVPALSTTRKPTPDYSRSLWRHLAIARAYEFGTYVGVSDWAHPSDLPRPASGVGGFADPTQVKPDRFFTPIGDSGVGVYDLDFDALAEFRADRIDRGFFWKKPGAREA